MSAGLRVEGNFILYWPIAEEVGDSADVEVDKNVTRYA
jgi:hypothetical protein